MNENKVKRRFGDRYEGRRIRGYNPMDRVAWYIMPRRNGATNLLAYSVHEPLRPSSLSVSLDATRTQVTRLLDGLEQRGLVVRSADAQDRRSLQLRLTPEGSALLALAMPLVQAVYVQIWSSIGDAGTHAMQQQLRLVHDRLQSMDASSTPAAD